MDTERDSAEENLPEFLHPGDSEPDETTGIFDDGAPDVPVSLAPIFDSTESVSDDPSEEDEAEDSQEVDVENTDSSFSDAISTIRTTVDTAKDYASEAASAFVSEFDKDDDMREEADMRWHEFLTNIGLWAYMITYIVWGITFIANTPLFIVEPRDELYSLYTYQGTMLLILALLSIGTRRKLKGFLIGAPASLIRLLVIDLFIVVVYHTMCQHIFEVLYEPIELMMAIVSISSRVVLLLYHIKYYMPRKNFFSN